MSERSQRDYFNFAYQTYLARGWSYSDAWDQAHDDLQCELEALEWL